MIISEKQIIQLMDIAQDVIKHLCFNHTAFQDDIRKVLAEIKGQQSEELKEIE